MRQTLFYQSAEIFLHTVWYRCGFVYSRTLLYSTYYLQHFQFSLAHEFSTSQPASSQSASSSQAVDRPATDFWLLATSRQMESPTSSVAARHMERASVQRETLVEQLLWLTDSRTNLGNQWWKCLISAEPATFLLRIKVISAWD